MKSSVADLNGLLFQPSPRTGAGRKRDPAPIKSGGPAGRITTTSRQPRVRCLGSAIFSEEAWSQIALSFQFSRRELQIVRGVFDDLTEMAIASELGISSHTVHTHFERLHRKMGIVDRAELLLRVVSEFLRLTAAADGLLPPICSRRTAGRCSLRD
jgi:DNA-binding CsgD family transcriptional regulator